MKAALSAVASRRLPLPCTVTFTRTGPRPTFEAFWIAVMMSWTLRAARRSTSKLLLSASVMRRVAPSAGAVTFASARPRTRSAGSAPLRVAAPVMSPHVTPPSVVA